MQTFLFSKLANASGLVLLFILGTCRGAQAREVVDSTGIAVHLVDHPNRIVTLVPSLGELAADLSGENLGRIVGVSEYTDYPPTLLQVKSVGTYARFNLETVLSLKPDLVLATHDGNAKDQIDHLRELKIPVVVVSTETIEEVEKSIRLVALALGNEKEGERMATQLHSGILHLRERAKKLNPVRTLLQVGGDPLVVVGRRSFLNEALEVVGGVNIYADSDAHYPRPSLEDAVARNPQVIITLILGADSKPFSRMSAAWRSFTSILAVQKNQVKLLKADQLLRPTMRLLEGLDLLEKAIHTGNGLTP